MKKFVIALLSIVAFSAHAGTSNSLAETMYAKSNLLQEIKGTCGETLIGVVSVERVPGVTIHVLSIGQPEPMSFPIEKCQVRIIQDVTKVPVDGDITYSHHVFVR